MSGLRIDFTDVSNFLFEGYAAKNKKQPRLTDIEYFHKLPGFKKAFNRGTFSPLLFGKLTRLIAKNYNPKIPHIHRTKSIFALLVVSTRECKSVNKNIH